MTNETFCRNRYIYSGLSIFGHILKGSIGKFTVTNDSYSGNRHIFVGAH